MILQNKSGVATKKGLVLGANTIDSDYQGEIHISLINTSNHIIAIREDEKITQGVIFKIHLGDVVVCDTIDLLYNEVSERGEGGFGSTNN